MATQNSLGLDFQETPPPQPDVASSPDQLPSTADPKHEKTERKKPYVNAERVKTGGPQRDKLSDEALAERMARIKEQNEKIKQRRLDVQADEEAFRKTQEAERVKHVQNRKVQEGVDRTREQNAKRKMDKIQSREWDSGKPTREWKQQPKKVESGAAEDASKPDAPALTAASASPPRDPGNWVRGSSRGGPRGRGRGRGGSANQGTPQRDNKPSKTESPPSAIDNVIPTTSPTTETPKDS